MLILEVKAGQSVSLIDEKNGQDVGLVKFMGLRCTKKDTILLGFQCPDTVKVLRESLLHGGRDNV